MEERDETYTMRIKYKFPTIKVDKEKYKKYNEKVKIFDSQLSKLPKKIKFCKRCVVSNQRPRTILDKEGVCNACRHAERKFYGGINWDQREQELMKLLDKHRSKDGSWDVIVPSSGGKDSAYVAHQLKERYGMHPLTITWAPFLYTETGWQNYANMIQRGFDGLIFWQNGILHRKLARIAFELKGDPFEPFVYGQRALAFSLACKFNIPLMMYGENGEVEYGGSFKNNDIPCELPKDWANFYYKGHGFEKLVEEGYKMGIFQKEELENTEFHFYNPPPIKKVKKLKLEMHWYSYYHRWIPQENFYYASKNTGFEASDRRTEATYTKYTSMDDQIDPFHWITGYMKFGLGRATREACSDIRCGHITREEGVSLVHRYDHEFPADSFKMFLAYVDLDEKKFWELMNRYRSEHVWKKEGSIWKLKTIVSNKSLEGEKPTEEQTPYSGSPDQEMERVD